MALSRELSLVLAMFSFAFFLRLPDLIRRVLHRLCSRRRYLSAWFAANFALAVLGMAGALVVLVTQIGRPGFVAGALSATAMPVLLLNLRMYFNALMWYKTLHSGRKAQVRRAARAAA